MQPTVQTGYFVLADISGYTSFMAETELEHSQRIMGDVLNLVVAQLTPLLTLAEVEGDAVFAYAPETKITRGETLLELIEATYVAFHEQLRAMQRQTTCVCRACQAIPSLDLKFVAHLGQYALQSVAGKKKPVGSEVNLVHRLLKNKTGEATGWHAYALFTEPTLTHMEVQPAGMYAEMESYEYLGDIKTLTLNLQDRYAELAEKRRVVLTEDEAHVTFTHDFTAPPPVVWEWLHDPDKRSCRLSGTNWAMGVRPKGRTGPNAKNHCAHGSMSMVERILDWHPFDYFTVEQTAFRGLSTFRATTRLIPRDGGTRLHSCYQLKIPLPDWLCLPLGRLFFLKMVKIAEGWETLDRLIAEAQRERQQAQ